jgi:hypothetical protein
MGAYSPFDNAKLVFQVYSSFSTDQSTGNLIQKTVEETYLCNIQLNTATSKTKAGANEVEIFCNGKLLSPSTFSSKIRVGMEASATINGLLGKLRILDLGSNVLSFARSTQFQEFRAEFEQIGAAG